jgi:hypothetical protein
MRPDPWFGLGSEHKYAKKNDRVFYIFFIPSPLVGGNKPISVKCKYQQGWHRSRVKP